MAAKTKKVVEAPKTKKFFKFVGNNLKSISARGNPLEYTPGTVLEVLDADPDTGIQCSSGIHCIYMEGDDEIYTGAISFGPKVAVLEALEDDVIYFAKDGKCRLKKCVVLDVGDGNNIPLKYQQGNNSFDFAQSYLRHVNQVTPDKSWTDLLSKHHNASQLLSEYAIKSGSYTAEIEAGLITAAQSSDYYIRNLLNAAMATGKVFNTAVVKEIIGKSDSANIIQWIEKFGDDEELSAKIATAHIVAYAEVVGHRDEFVDRLIHSGYTRELINYSTHVKNDARIEKFLLDPVNSVSLADITAYAIQNNLNTPAIRQAILDATVKRANTYSYKNYWYYDPYKEYVEHFGNADGVIEIAKLSPPAALLYAEQYGVTEELKAVIAKDSRLSYDYIMKIGPEPVFYPAVAPNIAQVLGITEKYGYIDALLKLCKNNITTLQRYTGLNGSFRTILNITRRYGVNNDFEDIIFNTFADISQYCYYAYKLDRSLQVVNWLKDNPNVLNSYRVTQYMKEWGSNPLLEAIYCIVAEANNDKETAANLIQKMYSERKVKYFKVVYNLSNGTKVSALVDKKTKHRKVYLNAGEVKTVDTGMVFTNIFDAYEFANLHGRMRYGSKNNLLIFECTGDSFTPARWTVDHTVVLTKGVDVNAVRAAEEPEKALDACNATVDKVRVELPSSGWLKNIRLSYQRSLPYYL